MLQIRVFGWPKIVLMDLVAVLCMKSMGSQKAMLIDSVVCYGGWPKGNVDRSTRLLCQIRSRWGSVSGSNGGRFTVGWDHECGLYGEYIEYPCGFTKVLIPDMVPHRQLC